MRSLAQCLVVGKGLFNAIKATSFAPVTSGVVELDGLCAPAAQLTYRVELGTVTRSLESLQKAVTTAKDYGAPRRLERPSREKRPAGPGEADSSLGVDTRPKRRSPRSIFARMFARGAHAHLARQRVVRASQLPQQMRACGSATPARLAAAETEMSGPGCRPSSRNIRAASSLSCRVDQENATRTLVAGSPESRCIQAVG